MKFKIYEQLLSSDLENIKSYFGITSNIKMLFIY